MRLDDRITTEAIMRLGPCEGWTSERVTATVAGRTFESVLVDLNIHPLDRLWLACFASPACVARASASDFADAAWSLHRQTAKMPRLTVAAIAAARAHARKEIDDATLRDVHAKAEGVWLADSVTQASAANAAWALGRRDHIYDVIRHWREHDARACRG